MVSVRSIASSSAPTGGRMQSRPERGRVRRLVDLLALVLRVSDLAHLAQKETEIFASNAAELSRYAG
jgi:hypothetical protein